PAIPDDVGRALPFHRQDPWPRLLTLRAYLRSDVLHGRPALGVYPPMRRHPQIPLSPQLAIDGGLAHSAAPEDKPIGLQGVQDAHERHAGIVSPDCARGPAPAAAAAGAAGAAGRLADLGWSASPGRWRSGPMARRRTDRDPATARRSPPVSPARAGRPGA